MLEIANPFPDEGGVLRLHEPVDCDRTKIIAQLLANTYPKPFIIEADGVRSLYFTRAFTQSALRLSAPYALEFGYTRMMIAALLFNPAPQRILMLGMGGGSLANFCHRHLATTQTTVVEIDANIIAWREQFMLPPDDARLRVVHADASDYLAGNCLPSEIIMLDAFDREGAAAADTVTSAQSFYAAVRKNLSPSGLLVANIVSSKTNRLGHLQGINKAFNGNIITLPIAHDGNYIAFAFRDNTFEPRWRWMQSQAPAMKKRMALDFPSYVAALNHSRKNGFLQGILHQSED